MTAEARELYVMDWWVLIGTSGDADEFAEGLSRRFVQHGEAILSRLSMRKAQAVAMGHAWFGAQQSSRQNLPIELVAGFGTLPYDAYMQDQRTDKWWHRKNERCMRNPSRRE